MSRKIAITPIEPLELEFADGTVKRAWFTNESMIKLATRYDDVNTMLEESKEKPYEAISKLLHCALSIENPEITLEETKKILICGGDNLLTEIYSAITESFNLTKDDIKKNMEKMFK